MSSREKQKEETKQLILDSTIDLLLDPEFTTLNTNTLAEHAEVSKGSIFHHFGSKDKLILAAVEKLLLDHFDRFLEESERNQLNETPRAILKRLTRANLELIVDHPNLTAFLLQILSDFKDQSNLSELDDFMSHFMSKTFNRIVPVFVELGWKEDEVGLISRLYLSILDGLGIQLELERNLPRSGKKFHIDIDVTTKMIVDLFDKRNKNGN